MLKFEELNGFVVDLSTEPLVRLELESVLHSEEDRDYVLQSTTLDGVRDFIVEYYTCFYDYVFCKKPNVYQIVEEDLYNRVGDIEDLKENIKHLQFSNTILTEKLNDTQEKLLKEIRRTMNNETI